ncbi:FkbM family methyltransferase [Natronorarus salvus]|uniref:FkbM family methyltransferase n=1 Tax=Natronorarus salvus TaxID=3117733 RepID=UPI002F260FB4
MRPGEVADRVRTGGRAALSGAYYRVQALNYRYELLAPKKRAGTSAYRSYDLADSHGDDPLLTALLSRIAAGEVVVDVGANTGGYALAVATVEPSARVIAIEPDPAIVDRLRRNVALNEVGDRVSVLPVAAGAEAGERSFYRSTYPQLGSLDRFNAERWGARIAEVVSVPVEPLDALLAAGRIAPPDHLKVDVEGTGHEVLAGASGVLDDHRPIVYVEPHASGPDETDGGGVPATRMRTLLDEREYRVRSVGDGLLCTPRSERR